MLQKVKMQTTYSTNKYKRGVKMGRGTGIILGLLGVLLPGYLFYVTWDILGITWTGFLSQGLFYQINLVRNPSADTDTTLR